MYDYSLLMLRIKSTLRCLLADGGKFLFCTLVFFSPTSSAFSSTITLVCESNNPVSLDSHDQFDLQVREGSNKPIIIARHGSCSEQNIELKTMNNLEILFSCTDVLDSPTPRLIKRFYLYSISRISGNYTALYDQSIDGKPHTLNQWEGLCVPVDTKF